MARFTFSPSTSIFLLIAPLKAIDPFPWGYQKISSPPDTATASNRDVEGLDPGAFITSGSRIFLASFNKTFESDRLTPRNVTNVDCAIDGGVYEQVQYTSSDYGSHRLDVQQEFIWTVSKAVIGHV